VNALSVAPHHSDGLVPAAAGNRYGFGGAARHIGSVRRNDSRRKSMCPIPGNVIRSGITDIAAGCWWHGIEQGLAIRPVVEAALRRPERLKIVSPVVPQRLADERTGNRMRRSKPAASRNSRPGQCLVSDKYKRNCAERRDNRPIHSIRHGTHQFVGCRAAPQATLGRALGARKCIINNWLIESQPRKWLGLQACCKRDQQSLLRGNSNPSFRTGGPLRADTGGDRTSLRFSRSDSDR
jgi:hypothetical protein